MAGREFPGKGVVAVLRARPDTILDDFHELMRLADYQAALSKDRETLLKVNISWQTWYPACSTTPWQLEGVIRAMQQDGYTRLAAAQNKTVVVDAYVGERNNKHKLVLDGHGVPSIHLYEPEVEWITYQPETPMLVLDRIFPEGIKIPKPFIGANVVHLPTVKTHVFTTITGAMKNGFGGLLNERRHWTHGVIHETLVDLLAIQQEIHPGIFAVMDGTFAGDGPGPRAMRAHEKDVILASSDLVAIDAISAKLQGFDPLALPFIRLAHERGMGVGDPSEIRVVGLDISGESWDFVQEDTFASRGQKLIYHGALKPFENLLLRSPLVPWSYFASNFYHNVYWYPVVGRRRVKDALATKWGRLFESYGDGSVVMPGADVRASAMAIGGAALLLGGAAWLAQRLRRR